MGVNLAGVEAVLKLQKKIQKLQGEINNLFNQTQGHLKQESEEYKEAAKKQAKRLLNIKQESSKKTERNPIDISNKTEEADKEKDKNKPVDVEIIDDWELDYNE